jgi:FkbM family methyltransferase
VNAQNDRLAQLYLRYASSLAGLRRLPVLGACARWFSTRLVPRDRMTWMQVQGGPAQGLWLLLNPRTGRDYVEGAVEPGVQKILKNYLRPGMTFYDIGANIGFFSLLAARLAGKQGKVISFEADPEVAARLREHVERNRFQTISVQEKAVWSETRTVAFARADARTSPDRGLGHVDLSATAADTVQVQAISLDDFACDAPMPDFVKCDAEGAEAQVFCGAQNLLTQKRPLILCEMHSEENRRTLIDLWTSLRYSCQPCGKHHVLALPQ